MGCTQSKHGLDSTVMHPSDCEYVQDTALLNATKQVRRSFNNSGKAQQNNSNRHRDVFSIFGDQGMVLEAQEAETGSPLFGAQLCSPYSASGSVFSTATTASDTERTQVVHGPTDQEISALNLSYGAYSDKGIRKQNEDRQVCTSQVIGNETVGYFGIYDGHGGAKVADYLAKNLYHAVFDRLEKNRDMATAVEDAFAATDDLIFRKQMESGSTSLSVLVRGRDAVVACVGDSQAVVCTNGTARTLSVLHSPDAEGELERITAAKGVVVKGRIFGLLGVSRAFGDNDFKTSRGDYKDKFKGDLVTAVPDVQKIAITPDDEFLVMGCDGLFEVMDPQQVVDFVRAKLALHGHVQHACEELVSYAISIGSTDNVTVVVVCFNQVVIEEDDEDSSVDAGANTL